MADTKARMTNPALLLPPTMEAIGKLTEATRSAGVDPRTLELVHLRASQINGCSACVKLGVGAAIKAGETTERLTAVAAWYESSEFDDAERAALALTEAATRLADRPGAVTDEIWDAAADHYDEKQLAAIILTIAVTNLFNRLNTTVRQPADVVF